MYVRMHVCTYVCMYIKCVPSTPRSILTIPNTHIHTQTYMHVYLSGYECLQKKYILYIHTCENRTFISGGRVWPGRW